MEKLERFFKGLFKKGDESKSPVSAKIEKKSSDKNFARHSLILFPSCKLEGRKEWSFIFEQFRIRLEEKPSGFAVFDPTSKKWIVFKKREKVKARPIFPIALELAKKYSEKFTAIRIFVTADCGAVDLTVVPQMDKVNEKFKVTKARKQEIETLRNNVVLAFVNSLALKPILLLTNDKSLLEFVERKIDSLPRTEEQKKELKKKVMECLETTDDLVEYLLSEVKDSKEIYLPKEIEISKQQVIALVLLSVLAVGGYLGYSNYEQKKEEEMKRLQSKKVTWLPTQSFKERHIFYKIFEPEIKSMVRLAYSLTPNVDEVSYTSGTGKIVYYFKEPVLGSKKDKKGFRKEVSWNSFPFPSWESVRERPPFPLPKIRVLYEVMPKDFKKAITEIRHEVVDGVLLKCFVIDYQKSVPLSEIQQFLLNIPIPYKIKEIQLTKNGIYYSLTLRTEICGR